MAAMSGKIFQNVSVAHYCQQNRQLHNVHSRDFLVSNLRSFLPSKRRKSAWNGILAMQLRNLSMNQSGLINRGSFYCNAASSATSVPLLEKSDFLKLQNGSDIRGVAVAGVDGEPVNLTEPVSEAIAAAFAAWLSDKKKYEASRPMRVSIGHDSRISATNLQDAVSRGLLRGGHGVLHFGLASTPAMFNSTLTEKEDVMLPVDGAIMITASHLPYNRNGFKFFTNAGGLGKADIKDILERASALYNKFSNEGVSESHGRSSMSIRRVDYMDIYAADLVQAVRKAAGDIEKPLEGFHIVVDAGNGAGGFFVAKVLEPLGAITSGSQFLEPDGMFPNHIPNPEDKAAMKAITQAVLDNKADLGIIFDTDVDRSAAVDSTGRELNRNWLIALMSAIILEEHPGTTIVTDSVTSDGLTAFIEKKLGGKHHRFKRGYKNVIDEAIRLNTVGEESHLAIETSGHGALKENHWLDDGAYLMVKLLNKLASAMVSGGGSNILTNLVEGLQEAAVSVELRLKIDQTHSDLKGGSFRDYGEAVLKHFENKVDSDSKLLKAPINYEGVRVAGFGGWFLLRLSLHDPVLPLNIEAPSNDEAVKLAQVVVDAVKEFPALDTSALNNFIQRS
ncbi:hypothetical protein RND81_04G127500 [Saponaria officinalis]|uniref:phosphoglucomutase (alpha-D-glucose-1,6-bisphosphate-dependent) n=1 Tax=Saponaria officinalis TaxID=3572 RepID=A0AAW1LLH3_SAPOF